MDTGRLDSGIVERRNTSALSKRIGLQKQRHDIGVRRLWQPARETRIRSHKLLRSLCDRHQHIQNKEIVDYPQRYEKLRRR